VDYIIAIILTLFYNSVLQSIFYSCYGNQRCFFTKMLDNLQIFVLAIVQGITEFLPVSSSAHLILVPKLFGWPDQGLLFDVAVHFGSLLAVLLYFRKELITMTKDWIAFMCGKEATAYSHLAWLLIIATLPVCLIGWLFHDIIEQFLRSPLVIAASTIVFAFLLWFSDSANREQKSALNKNISEMTWQNALKIGAYQMLALVPGVSRSGITLTAGLGLGFSREQAARFSFLLSIPVIIAAVALEGLSLYIDPTPMDYSPLLLAMSISAVCAYGCIYFFLKLINQWGMLPFVVYRIILGSILFFYFV